MRPFALSLLWLASSASRVHSALLWLEAQKFAAMQGGGPGRYGLKALFEAPMVGAFVELVRAAASTAQRS